MTFKNKHHEKKIIRKPSKNDVTRKSIVRVEASSSISSNPVGVYLWSCDLTNPSKEDKGKVKGENSKRHEKSHQKEIIVENENVEICKEKEIKLPQENVKMYKGVRQRKWGKWVAEVYDPRKKGCIWLGTFNTAEEAALVYDKAIIAIKGVDAVTNILKPPPKEINFMNLPSSSLDNPTV